MSVLIRFNQIARHSHLRSGTHVPLENCYERFNFARGCISLWLVRVASTRPQRLADGRTPMSVAELVALVLSVGLLIYLAIALLKPEWFA